jgi:hypothetical protein
LTWLLPIYAGFLSEHSYPCSHQVSLPRTAAKHARLLTAGLANREVPHSTSAVSSGEIATFCKKVSLLLLENKCPSPKQGETENLSHKGSLGLPRALLNRNGDRWDYPRSSSRGIQDYPYANAEAHRLEKANHRVMLSPFDSWSRNWSKRGSPKTLQRNHDVLRQFLWQNQSQSDGSPPKMQSYCARPQPEYCPVLCRYG